MTRSALDPATSGRPPTERRGLAVRKGSAVRREASSGAGGPSSPAPTRTGRSLGEVAPVILAMALTTLAACRPAAPRSEARVDNAATVAAPTRLTVEGPIQPVPYPEDLGLDPERVALGRALFHDGRLSGDGTITCATCHPLDRGGVDRLPVSRGIGGRVGTVNAPSVLNAGLLFRLFWDGRADSLEEQVDGPLLQEVEMGSTWESTLGRLRADPDLAARFERAYPGGLSEASVRSALATFQRSLLTPDSPFDRYLRGEEDALSTEARAGYLLFQSYGCASCHHGVAVGGSQFARFGVIGDYFADRGDVTEADLGRYNVTGVETDRHVFRVPSLRNVALTPPYFHDGRTATLADAVRTMARYQLGRSLDDAEVAELVAFLESLTGRLPGEPS